jgi:hypothetical protein
MSPSPLSPRLLKGAIVAVDLDKSKQTTIAFQYNPETVTRTLEPQLAGGEGGAALAGRALHRRPGGDHRRRRSRGAANSAALFITMLCRKEVG